jgi:hypothetical protein
VGSRPANVITTRVIPSGQLHLADHLRSRLDVESGTAITDEFGQPFTAGRKIECKVGDLKVSLMVWGQVL